MLTLHGFAYSNYYNIPKHALLYKGIEFRENLVYPSQEGFADINPASKVPALTIEDGRHLAEASVICEYIEDRFPEPALLPSAPYDRNQVRQIMRASELYLELPCRRLLPFVFTRSTPPQALQDEVNTVLDRGIASLNGLCNVDPFLTGGSLTLGDIYLRYVLQVVKTGAALLSRDVVAEIRGLETWQEKLAADPISKKIDADTAANREDFFAYIASRQ